RLLGDPAQSRRDRPQVLGSARSRDHRRAARGVGRLHAGPPSVSAAPAEATGSERARSSPYQGLVPYSEADADWFFGRDDWRDIILDNLRAYRLSILYGASGVGKSPVLNAGVVRALRSHASRP